MPPQPPPDDEILGPREAARVRRRDRDADAERRDLMRPGMGKVFKQIDESIVRRAQPRGHAARRSTPPDA